MARWRVVKCIGPGDKACPDAATVKQRTGRGAKRQRCDRCRQERRRAVWRARDKRYYWRHIERSRQRDRERHSRPEHKKRRSRRSRLWRESNPGEAHRKDKAYYWANRVTQLAKAKAWRESHRDEIRKRSCARWRSATPAERRKHRERVRAWFAEGADRTLSLSISEREENGKRRLVVLLDPANGAFYEAARQAVPLLLAEREEMLSEIARLRLDLQVAAQARKTWDPRTLTGVTEEGETVQLIRRDEVEAFQAEALSVLREVEQARVSDDPCPVCRGYLHDSDCRLAAILS